jgi:hypothetical protein
MMLVLVVVAGLTDGTVAFFGIVDYRRMNLRRREE